MIPELTDNYIRRENIEEILHSVVIRSVLNNKNSQAGLLIEGGGGVGKTIALRQLKVSCKSKEHILTSSIHDLRNPAFWNFNYFLNYIYDDICIEDIEQKGDFLNSSTSEKIFKINDLLSKTRKIFILFLDTSECCEGSTSSFLIKDLVVNLVNSVIVIAGRKTSKVNNRAKLINNFEKIQLNGFTLNEAERYYSLLGSKKPIPPSKAKNIIKACEDKKNNFNPLFLSLSAKILTDEDEYENFSIFFNKEISDADKEHYRQALLLYYFTIRENILSLWLALIKNPIKQEMFLKLRDYLAESENITTSISWNSYLKDEWVRTDNAKGVYRATLHDQISENIFTYNLPVKKYYDRDRLNRFFLTPILKIIKEIDDKNNPEMALTQDEFEILHSPYNGIKKTISRLKEKYSEVENLNNLESRSLNFINILTKNNESKTDLIDAYELKNEIYEALTKNKDLLISAFELFSDLCEKNIITYEKYNEFHEIFTKEECFNKSEKSNLAKKVTNLAIRHHQINDLTLKYLNDRIYYSTSASDKIRAYNTLGYYHRLSSDSDSFDKARNNYLKAIEIIISDEIYETPLNFIGNLLNNLASLEAFCGNNHYSLFLIDLSSKFYKNYKDTSLSLSDHYLQKSHIYKKLSNYSVAFKYCIEACELAPFQKDPVLRLLETKIFMVLEGEEKHDLKEIQEEIEEINDTATTKNLASNASIDALNGFLHLSLFKKNGRTDEIIKSINYYNEAFRFYSHSDKSIDKKIDAALGVSTATLHLALFAEEDDFLTNAASALNTIQICLFDSENLPANYISLLKLHKNHWEAINSQSLIATNLTLLDRFISDYVSNILPILRGDTGSKEPNGMPYGYEAWSLFFQIVPQEFADHLSNGIIKKLAEKNEFTVVNNIDYRAALISIPSSYRTILLGKNNSKNNRAERQLERAINSFKTGDLEKARSLATDAIVKASMTDSICIILKGQLELAHIDSILGNHQDAVTLANIALQQTMLADKNCWLTRIEVAECYRIHAEVYRYSHNYSRAWDSYCYAHNIIYQDYKNSFMHAHLLQEMAICHKQASLESEVLSSEYFDADTNATQLINQSIEIIDSNKELQLLKPMAYFRKGIIINNDESYGLFKIGLKSGWEACNEKAIMFSLSAIIAKNVELWLEGKNPKNSLALSNTLDVTLEELLYFSSESCTDEANKLEQYPSLNAQLHLTYEIFKLCNNQASTQNFSLVFSNLAPKIFGSPLSTIGRDGEPLHYSLWLKALRRLDRNSIKDIVKQVNSNWSKQNSFATNSCAWAFLINLEANDSLQIS